MKKGIEYRLRLLALARFLERIGDWNLPKELGEVSFEGIGDDEEVIPTFTYFYWVIKLLPSAFPKIWEADGDYVNLIDEPFDGETNAVQKFFGFSNFDFLNIFCVAMQSDRYSANLKSNASALEISHNMLKFLEYEEKNE